MAPAIAASMIPQLIEATNSIKNRIGTPIIEFGIDSDLNIVRVDDKACMLPIRVSPAAILTIGGLTLLTYIIWSLSRLYNPTNTEKLSMGGNLVKQMEQESGKDLGSWLWW